MKEQPVDAPSVLRLHIGRLAIDAAVLGDLPREQFVAEMQTTLAQRLSATAAMTPKAPSLAGHIADVVAPQVQQRLPSRAASGDRNGAL